MYKIGKHKIFLNVKRAKLFFLFFICSLIVSYFIIFKSKLESKHANVLHTHLKIPKFTTKNQYMDSNEFKRHEAATEGNGTQSIKKVKSLDHLIIKTRQPMYSGIECRDISINLYKRETFNLTGLVSYPGSGNTWLRHLIELATGVFTGSIYCDVDLIGKGFIGEKEPWTSGSTIVQKLHLKYTPEYDFTKAIILLREPYQAIVSFVQYLESGHTGHAHPSTFLSKDWPVYALGQMFSWISLTKSWIESPTQLLIVHYESLLKNPPDELRKICKFLLVDCIYLEHKCLKKNLSGSFRRNKSKSKPKVPYKKWMRDKMDDGIDYLNSLMFSYGHDPIPLRLYRFYRVQSNETIYI